MSKPLKKLNEFQIKALLKDAERALEYVQINGGLECKGYTKVHFQTLIKQLKGEFPII